VERGAAARLRQAALDKLLAALRQRLTLTPL
jgi:hypothetical protein